MPAKVRTLCPVELRPSPVPFPVPYSVLQRPCTKEGDREGSFARFKMQLLLTVLRLLSFLVSLVCRLLCRLHIVTLCWCVMVKRATLSVTSDELIRRVLYSRCADSLSGPSGSFCPEYPSPLTPSPLPWSPLSQTYPALPVSLVQSLSLTSHCHVLRKCLLHLISIPSGHVSTPLLRAGPDGSIQCQHGPKECTGNIWENCAIAQKPQFEDHWKFILCLEQV